MKTLVPFFVLLMFPPCAFASVPGAGPDESVHRLMPVPASLELDADSRFRVDSDLRIRIVGEPHPRLSRQASRFLRRLDARTGLFLEQGWLSPENRSPDANVILEVSGPGKVHPDMEEQYQLRIDEDRVILSAGTDIGVMRGLETLLQLLDTDEEGFYFQGLTIRDEPRFSWRGLMIDSCRHFMPLEVLKRNLEAMASVKLNVLHWHLTEDQGFRIESKTYPLLHQMGSDGNYYTHEQIREIVAFADELGIRVVPELDIPGHATSWLVGYPELGSAPGPYEIERYWGIFDPCLNPASEYTYTFLEQLFDEVTALFPDPYFHIGGDEVNGKHWDQNPEIQAFMADQGIVDNHALQAYFNRRVLRLLQDDGKRMIGWDEILQPGMPKDVVIHSWRGRESMEEAARQGYASILSNGYYIDLMHPAADHYLNDPLPPGSGLSPSEEEKILGGEATMWSEHVTPETIDSRIWPRTAAIAERLWSPVGVRDVENMYKRLDHMAYWLEEHGLTHRKNRPMMMRRLTMGSPIEPLRILADVVEPLEHYDRPAFRVYNQFSPYTLLADIALADAPDSRTFRKAVDQYLRTNSPEALAEVQKWLEKWRDNRADFRELAEQAPAIREGLPLVERLAELSESTLLFIQDRDDAPSTLEFGELLGAARQPVAATEIPIVDCFEELFSRWEQP